MPELSASTTCSGIRRRGFARIAPRRPRPQWLRCIARSRCQSQRAPPPTTTTTTGATATVATTLVAFDKALTLLTQRRFPDRQRDACHAGEQAGHPGRRQHRDREPDQQPDGSKTKLKPLRNSPRASSPASARLKGHATSAASAQLRLAVATASATTISHTARGAAPMARSTPISRRRSRTFRLLVMSPRPPTAARTLEHDDQEHVDHPHVLVEADAAMPKKIENHTCIPTPAADTLPLADQVKKARQAAFRKRP